MEYILILTLIIIIVLLILILKELRALKSIVELPPAAKKSYDEQLNKLEGEIKNTFALMLVAPDKELEKQTKKKFTELVNKQKDLLKERRKHFFVRKEYLE